MTQDRTSKECQTKCLLASAVGGVLALVLVMALFGAAFLVAVLLAVVVFFALAYGLPRHYCAQAQDEQPAAPAKAAAPVAKTAPAKAVEMPIEKPTEKPTEKPANSAPAASVAKKPAKTPAKPTASAKPDAASDATGTQPTTLNAPRDGKADNLKRIKGVGPKLESLLHEMGFYHFDQIAGWTADEVTWVDQNLQGVNKGRASRDDWVAQAIVLASGDETEFSKRASTGDESK